MVQMPEFYGALSGCQLPLVQTFGSKMYSIGVMTMIIRLIQVFNCFVLIRDALDYSLLMKPLLTNV